MRDSGLLTRLLGRTCVFCLLCLSVPVTHIIYASLVWADSVGRFYQVLNTELQNVVLFSSQRVEESLTTMVENAYSTTYQLSGTGDVRQGREIPRLFTIG